MRPLLAALHRFVGLVLAGFLLIAGVTGALLVWYHELDAALAPQLHHVTPPAADARPLDPVQLRERVAAAFPQAQVNVLELHAEPGASLRFWVELGKDAGGEPVHAEAFVDPYTGDVLGTRRWGDLSQGPAGIMPFLYELHYSLALGTIGTTAFGIVALLWTLDCFVGAALTLPARRRRAASDPPVRHGYWRRWWPAWRVRLHDGDYKRNYDLHRAGGLWLWALLFVLAWSGVGFNLKPVYKPVMEGLFPHQDEVARMPRRSLPAEARMDWQAALDRARALMAEEARTHGFTVRNERLLSWDAGRGAWRYRVRSDRDLGTQRGSTSLYLDGATGERLALYLPTGKAAGDTIGSWLFALHMAAVGGLPFRLLMTVVGIAVGGLSVTGVYIWLRKRRSRRQRAAVSTGRLAGGLQSS